MHHINALICSVNAFTIAILYIVRKNTSVSPVTIYSLFPFTKTLIFCNRFFSISRGIPSVPRIIVRTILITSFIILVRTLAIYTWITAISSIMINLSQGINIAIPVRYQISFVITFFCRRIVERSIIIVTMQSLAKMIKSSSFRMITSIVILRNKSGLMDLVIIDKIWYKTLPAWMTSPTTYPTIRSHYFGKTQNQ